VSDLWLWAERLSWLVAIIGIPGLIIGLATMVRRPRLAVGFLPIQKSGIIRRVERPTQSLDVKLAFTLDPNLSDAITLQFVIKNIGRGSARELLVNFLFPAHMQLSQVSAAGAPANTQFLIHPRKNQPLWTFSLSHIHPDDEAFCPTAIRVPKGLSTVDIDVEVSMADAATVRDRLHIFMS
jgi:hypothetical protein